MITIIDTNNETTRKLSQLKSSGVECIIRYISTSTRSEKCIKRPEAQAIADAGLKLGLVFEVWGGSDDFSHGDINATTGAQHGTFAKNWAENVGAPDGTIIWFAIDNDVNSNQLARCVRPYFEEVRKALSAKFRTGIYGCGYACQQCLDLGIVEAAWLSNAMGWNGSRQFRASNRWHLLQGQATHLFGLDVNTDQASGDDYGAFIPFGRLPSAELQVRKEADIVVPQQGTAAPAPRQATAVSPTPALARADQTGTAANPPILSPIDKALGGEAMVGLKTPLAILAYLLLWLMQTFGAVGTATGDKATTTGQVLTALIAAFGGLGVSAKIDRAVKAMNAISAATEEAAQAGSPLAR